MNKDQIMKIIELRNHVLGMYNTLDGKHEPMAVVKQKDIAEDIETAIKKIDNLLKNHVNFS